MRRLRTAPPGRGLESAGQGGDLRRLSSNPGTRGTKQRSKDVPPQPTERRSADAATLRLYEDFLECVTTGKKPDGADIKAADLG